MLRRLASNVCSTSPLTSGRHIKCDCASLGEIQDIDFKRSLAETETGALRNAWMNDVRERMSLDCLQHFNNLIQEADELDKGKAKGSAAKPAWAVGKGQGSGPGPK